MTTYVALTSFTEQGLRGIKDTTKRADAVREMAGKYGVQVKELYWTQGQYDLVLVCEAKDEIAISAFGLATASAGNVRMETMRAFNRDEMNQILGKLP